MTRILFTALAYAVLSTSALVGVNACPAWCRTDVHTMAWSPPCFSCSGHNAAKSSVVGGWNTNWAQNARDAVNNWGNWWYSEDDKPPYCTEMPANLTQYLFECIYDLPSNTTGLPVFCGFLDQEDQNCVGACGGDKTDAECAAGAGKPENFCDRFPPRSVGSIELCDGVDLAAATPDSSSVTPLTMGGLAAAVAIAVTSLYF